MRRYKKTRVNTRVCDVAFRKNSYRNFGPFSGHFLVLVLPFDDVDIFRMLPVFRDPLPDQTFFLQEFEDENDPLDHRDFLSFPFVFSLRERDAERFIDRPDPDPRLGFPLPFRRTHHVEPAEKVVDELEVEVAGGQERNVQESEGEGVELAVRDLGVVVQRERRSFDETEPPLLVFGKRQKTA